MALMGGGVLANWGSVLPASEEDYNAWHSLEHMAERLAVPGFLRGRRGIAVNPEEDRLRYLMIYEVAEPAVLVSEPYLARLNDPTAWTQRILSSYLSPSRTVCRVRVTTGRGVGGWCGAVILQASGNSLPFDDIIAGVAGMPGVVGVHGLEGDPDLGQTPTAEKHFRESQGQADATVGAAFLVEGYDPEMVGTALLSLEQHVRVVAGGGQIDATLYQIQHVVAVQD